MKIVLKIVFTQETFETIILITENNEKGAVIATPTIISKSLPLFASIEIPQSYCSYGFFNAAGGAFEI